VSLVLVDTRGLAGYRAGRPIEKLGMHGQDTCELFFDGAEVPAACVLGGTDGQGFPQMMAQLPASRLTTIPACGHVPQQECPARFGAALSDVLTMPPPLPALREAPGVPAAPGAGPGR
jgi:acyl-CoA dehydrogenase